MPIFSIAVYDIYRMTDEEARATIAASPPIHSVEADCKEDAYRYLQLDVCFGEPYLIEVVKETPTPLKYHLSKAIFYRELSHINYLLGGLDDNEGGYYDLMCNKEYHDDSPFTGQ